MPANDKYWRNIRTMHVVFAFSSIAVFAVTIWMMGEDHARAWRDYQRTFLDLEAEKLRVAQQEEQTEEYQQLVDELRRQHEQARQAAATIQDELAELQTAFKEAEHEFNLAERAVKTRRQIRGVAAANYDLGVRDELPQEELDRLFSIYQQEADKLAEMEGDLQAKQADRDEARQRLDEKRAETGIVEAEAQLDAANAEIERIQTALARIDPEGVPGIKHKIMEWYIIDAFNSHLKIQNDWLPDLQIKLGMSETARFDRCRTCHQGIDRTDGADDYGNVIHSFPHGEPLTDSVEGWVAENTFPHPYSTHPHPELYVTASSPHPSTEGSTKFGCTICHEGQGSGTNFSTAAHYPNHPHEHEEWEEEYGFKTNHFWEYPMYPRRFVESSCLKCHHNVEELETAPNFGQTAPKLVKGYHLIEEYGCFGCHQINGFQDGRSIGPDLRLAPNYTETARQLLYLMTEVPPADEGGSAASGVSVSKIRELAQGVLQHPGASESERARLQQLFQQDADAKNEALRALREEHAANSVPVSERRAAEAELRASYLPGAWGELVKGLKSEESPGRMRKVGPSLRHVESKTFRAWLEYWVDDPTNFRPTTRMPRFFHLTNQHDDLARRMQPVEIAGVAQYLLSNSQPLELLSPEEGYQPDAQRGKEAFTTRGCLACHSHKAVPESTQDFGPDLSRIGKKLASGGEGFDWLYTWILNPEKHHPRTRMPNLYINTDEKDGLKRGPDGKVTVDPAADIAAFLLQEDAGDELPEYTGEPLEIGDEALDELVKLHLQGSKVLRDREIDRFLEADGDIKFPIAPGNLKGDEIELTKGSQEGLAGGADEWRRIRLNYVGRRTISRYGCFGCHDIPGFEAARPIGTALQDWGRKDTTKLALEHIEEYLHHHGEPDGSSTHERAEEALLAARAGEFRTPEVAEKENRLAYFYDDLLHHGRPGFLFQKLRQPRSYDYRKIETRRYDERLRMPKFSLSEADIEAIATFVLGLVAEPPAEQYVYTPDAAGAARVEGERLLRKYNCTGCHVVELPEITYAANPDLLPYYDPSAEGGEKAFELLMKLKPPREATTGRTTEEGEPILRFHGLKLFDPDPDEDPEFQEYSFNSWENLTVNGRLLRPPSMHRFQESKLVEYDPGRGGDFARMLVNRLSENTYTDRQKRDAAWQAAPPPLYQEGIKTQTPRLYRFLLEPPRLRHTTVLRMPRFNMSDEEAHSLANYFAAVDGVPFPYQDIPQREPDYLPEQIAGSSGDYPQLTTNRQYLHEAWKLLNHPKACINCHSVGGNEVRISDPQTDIRGPNLEYTSDRLRPEWLMLWLYRPNWITPYTSMPALFDENQVKFNLEMDADYPFGGREGVPSVEAVAVRDALMNYYRLLEAHGKQEIPPATAAADQ